MNVTSATSLSTVDTQLVVGAGANNPPAPTSDGPGAPATANISGPGRMFHQLSELSKSDPAKFKQVVSDMASALRADAQNATGDQASRLSQLADRLDKVAQSGNLSDLAPQSGSGSEGAHHAHHGGHHHGGGAVFSDLESAFSAAMSNDGASTQPSTSTSTG
jgi:hypothetical protein